MRIFLPYMFLPFLPRRIVFALAVILTLTAPSIAQAGMPGVVFTDLATFRIEAISFFVVGFLACAGCVGWLWNNLAGDIFKLPRLSYGKALGLTTLWGLLFVLVLTMVSGARELMTPGAWTKRGSTYKLGDVPPPRGIEPSRRQKLLRLRDALRAYGADHEGHLPGDVDSANLAEELWTTTDSSGMHYVYFGASAAGGDDRLIVMEPDVFHGPRLALTAGGKIVEISEPAD
jgi:hypothetical protein